MCDLISSDRCLAHEAITTIKTANVSIIPKVFPCPFSMPPSCPLTPSLGNQWCVLYHCTLVSLAYSSHNWVTQHGLFCLASFTQQNYLEIPLWFCVHQSFVPLCWWVVFHYMVMPHTHHSLIDGYLHWGLLQRMLLWTLSYTRLCMDIHFPFFLGWYLEVDWMDHMTDVHFHFF